MNGLALIFHELATNAAKYGALSTEGAVDIHWREENGDLILSWLERGGPAVASAPSQEGFGSALVRKTVEGQFGGIITYDCRREGLAMQMKISLSDIAH